MGILNVTPDSFHDGGRFDTVQKALDRAQAMISEGADIIDIGGESTKPGAPTVPEKEELRRVIPIIQKLVGLSGIPISIDTRKAAVASESIHAGASIINDISGLRHDAQMIELAATSGAGLIVTHMQGTPETMQNNPRYHCVVTEVIDCFRETYRRCLESGINPERLAFDPGIGFGKTLEHNLQLLQSLEQLLVHDRPIVLGVSYKSFIGRLLSREEHSARKAPTIALTAIARQKGARIFRVHDVRENREALVTAEALMNVP